MAASPQLRWPWRCAPGGGWWRIAGARLLSAMIRLCGDSAILFVLGIFVFVLMEARPVVGSGRFSLVQFLTSPAWYPTSELNKRYGVWAMIVGTFSVTGLAMAIAVRFGFGAAIFLPSFVRPAPEKR